MHAHAPDTVPLAAAAPPSPRRMTSLDINTRFKLGDEITDEQRAFLREFGFLVFEQVATPDELANILAEADRIEAQWIREGRTKVNGIPLFVGRDEVGEPLIQRLPFTSLHSQYIRAFVRDPRFRPVVGLIGDDARVGDDEKDGAVISRYVNLPGSVHPRLGWHTDGLRDIAYLRRPKQMLNVGLHFDRVTAADGGLRLIPGTHRQSLFAMCFFKPYFVAHAPDHREIAIETMPGDLTVHDGRLWHRAQASPHFGRRSLRRTMYLPYLTDEYQPKTEDSATPIYHHIGVALRRVNRWRAAQRAKRS